MQHLLNQEAKAWERKTGFVQRSSAQLDGPTFVQTLVFGWLSHPDASYSQLRHVAASLGANVSAQAVEQRIGPQAVALLKHLVQQAATVVMSSEARVPELLARFAGVYLQDGTLIMLPEALANQWHGCGNEKTGTLRIQVRLDWGHGQVQGPWLQPGQEAERSGEAMSTPLPTGSLFVADMGYFTLAQMQQREAAGQYWLTPAKADLIYRDQRGQRWDLASLLQHQQGKTVDLPVRVGAQEVPMRLLEVRVSPEEAARRRERANKQITGPHKGVQRPNERPSRVKRTSAGKMPQPRKRRQTSAGRRKLLGWTILLTNVPVEKLSVQEAVVLMRCRWQEELFWKLLKQIGRIDTWRSGKPDRILAEILAKLLGQVLTHWLMLLQCWQAPNRSLVKARQVSQWLASSLALGVAGVVPLEPMVLLTGHTMGSGCRVGPRQKRPATYQLLANPSLLQRSKNQPAMLSNS